MPISLIALWFRQRAERQGFWALCAAVLQPGCHLGGWIVTLPWSSLLSALPFSSVKWNPVSHGAVRHWLRPGVPGGTRAADEGFCQMYAHTCARDRSNPLCGSSSPISLSVQKLEVSEGLQHLSSERDFTQCAQSKPQVLWWLFYWLLGLWGLNLRAKRSKQKKEINWKQMAEPVHQRAGDNQQYQFTRKVYEGRRAKIPLEKR